MRLELPIIRVQVQLDQIKPGRVPDRAYRPEILHVTNELVASPDGCIGRDADGTEHLDVHHHDHPASRDTRRRSGLSIMTTGDYRSLRHTYGPHLVDGIAGESMLLDYEPGLARRTVPGTLTVLSADGTRTVLDQVRVAKPCVEFTRFCLRQPPSGTADDAVRQGLADLDDGARGYKMAATQSVTIRTGDRLVWDVE